MATDMKVEAEVTSEKGFYVGDVCYQMTDKDYYGDWSNDFEDFEGEHELHGHKFAIGGTKYGDGVYEDQNGHRCLNLKNFVTRWKNSILLNAVLYLRKNQFPL